MITVLFINNDAPEIGHETQVRFNDENFTLKSGEIYTLSYWLVDSLRRQFWIDWSKPGINKIYRFTCKEMKGS